MRGLWSCILVGFLFLAPLASSFDLWNYDIFGSSTGEPWNVCAHDTCNCDVRILDALEEGLQCDNKNIQRLQDDMIIPAQFLTVDFSDNNITNIHTNTFYGNNTHVLHLIFTGNNMVVLENDSFSNLPNLESLDLSNNVLEVIGEDAFRGLSELKSLDLSYNSLRSLNPDIFNHIEGLESLLLEYNPINGLPDALFAGLTSLKTLDLTNLRLKTLHEDIFNDLNIEDLRLVHNQLEVLPTKALFKLEHCLKKLDLSGNPIKVLPTYSLYSLTHLTTLKFEQMVHLTHIEKFAFDKLSNLHTVVFRYLPRIEYISEEAFMSENNGSHEHCPILDFTLSYSVMDSLPETLLDWNKLKYLNVRNNRWRCDCKLAWLKNSAVERLAGDTFFCSEPQRMRGAILAWSSKEDFECHAADNDPPLSVNLGFVVVLLILSTMLSLATVAVLFYRRNGFLFSSNYSTLRASKGDITVYDSDPRSAASNAAKRQAAGVDSEGEGVTNPNYRDSTKGEAVVNVNDHEELFRN